MTIAVASARAAALLAAGTENNPFVTGAALTGTYNTAIGTEVLAAGNAVTGSTFDPWTATPNGSAQAAWRVVFAGNQTPTFVGIAAHNLADVAATVRVQYSTDSGATWNDSGAGSVSPTDNQAIGFRFSGVTADYWRVFVSGATDDVSIGVIWIGSELVVEDRFYQGYSPPITPTAVDLRTNVSEGGHLLGAAYQERGSTFEATFQHLTPGFVRGASWVAFQTRWNRGYGSFWAWRPTQYGDLHYAWNMGEPLRPTNSGPKDYMSATISGRMYHAD